MADLPRKERIPMRNTKNTRGDTRENTRETFKPTTLGHTYARSSKHK